MSKSRIALSLGSMILGGLSSLTAQGQPSFRGLGDLSGGSVGSHAEGVSGDGSTVVGYSMSANGSEAFSWSELTGTVALGDLIGGGFESIAFGASTDGATITGQGHSNSGYQAWRWTAATGMVGLKDLPDGDFYSLAFAISADGNAIAGLGSSDLGIEAFRWDPIGGLSPLGALDDDPFFSMAEAISADGTWLAGHSKTSDTPAEACAWHNGKIIAIGDLDGGEFYSFARGVSNAGVVVGHAHDGGARAFRWSEVDGISPLDGLPDDKSTEAEAITPDGSVIVGLGDGPNGTRALMWIDDSGAQDLADLLSAGGCTTHLGWTLRAFSVSDDGRTIVGHGTNPCGDPEGWIARLDGPPLSGCYADCEASCGYALDLFDFLCFVNKFNAGDSYADCTGDGGLDLFDFLCFVNAFNAGC